jgi:hypothetical protein
MKHEQEYKQMTESILAQKDKPLFTKEKLRRIGGDTLRALGAAAFLTLSLPNIGTAIDAHHDATQSHEFELKQAQSGNYQGAHNALKDAEQYEASRNWHAGVGGLELLVAAGNISVLALNRRDRRTKEVVTSGEKPTEPSDK